MRRDEKYSVSIYMVGLLCFWASACQSSILDSNPSGIPDSTLFSNPLVPSQSVQPLTLEGLTGYFPEKVNGLQRSAIHVRREDKTAMAIYGDNLYSISITDDLFNHHLNLLSFDRQYIENDPEVKDKTHIATVLNGYRTLTTLHDQTISISFVFKNRYLIKVTGYQQQSPYRVWQFLQLNTFKNLPE